MHIRTNVYNSIQKITSSEKQMTEEPNAEKANNETTKKKTCHNRHTNQILRPAVDASAA